MPFLDDLDARLIANPRDGDARRDYIDWWMAHGDPRGEFAEVNLALASAPAGDRSRLKARRNALASAYPDLAPPELMAAERDSEAQWPDRRHPSGVYATWVGGLLHGVQLGRPTGRSRELLALVRAVVEHPASRVLSWIAIGEGADDYRPIVEALVGASLPGLRGLDLPDRDLTPRLDVPLGDLAPLWRASPRLASLTLAGRDLDLGSFELPALQTLTVRTSVLGSENLGAVGATPRPDLERLFLDVGKWSRDVEPALTLLELPKGGTHRPWSARAARSARPLHQHPGSGIGGQSPLRGCGGGTECGLHGGRLLGRRRSWRGWPQRCPASA